MVNDSNRWRNFIRIITILNAIAWPVVFGWVKYVTFKVIDHDKALAVQSGNYESIKVQIQDFREEMLRRMDKLENRIFYGRR